uniref:RIKEN cDNA 1700029H14 gene n=1 Tax=Cricetulus griseus TaxID=10029 RepID=A0A8C2M151_CRIGR
MEKDPTTHRRHRPGPGALPSGVVPGYLKVASEGAELQRSRSVGGLHQKGDPPVCIRKLLRKELDSEDQGKDPRSDTNDTTCQASLEEDRKKKSQDEPGKVDQTCGKLEPEKSNSEASASEQDGAQKGRHTSVAEVRLASGSSLINYYHTEEEVVTCAVREEKRPPLDTGDLSEDETRTSWMCCIPYSTKKKVKETANALEKGQSDSSQWRPKAGTLLQPKTNHR